MIVGSFLYLKLKKKGNDEMNNFINVIIISIILEGLINTIKEVKKGKDINKVVLLSIVFGIIIAVATNINIFEILGIGVDFPYVGSIFTGILISRGSNFVHDLISKLNENLK